MTAASLGLRSYLYAHGLTAEDVVTRCGVSAQSVGHWLAGTREPSPESLDRLCVGLGATPAELGMPGGAHRTPPGRSRYGSLSRREEIIARRRQGQSEGAIARDMGVPGKVVSRVILQAGATPRPVTPAPKEPVAEWLRGAMSGTTSVTPWCQVCGSTDGLEQHHVVRRSQGGKDGPTLTLCRRCHADVHAQRLHLRWKAVGTGGHWEWLRAEGKTFELACDPALEGAWRPVGRGRR